MTTYVVYLIIGALEPGSIKVGVTSNPADRLRALQTGNPIALSMEYLLTTTDKQAAYLLEQRIHKCFSFIRLKGEWFDNLAYSLLTASDMDIDYLSSTIERHIDLAELRAIRTQLSQPNLQPELVDV